MGWQKNKLDDFKWRDELKMFCIPSVRSFISLIIIFALLYLFRGCTEIKLDNPAAIVNKISNTIVILTGIAGIIFALIIFIAQSLSNDKKGFYPKVLLEESLIFPLTGLVVMMFLSFLFFIDKLTYLDVAVIGFIGLLTMISLYRVVRLLFDSYLFMEKRNLLFVKKSKEFFNLILNEIKVKQIIPVKLKEKSVLSLEYNISKKKEKLEPIKSTKKGIITDINPKKLEKFLDKIETEANKYNLSFCEEKVRPIKDVFGIIKEDDHDNKYFESKVLFNSLAKIEFRVNAFQKINKNDVLLFIEKCIIKKDKVRKKLEKLVRKIFIVKKTYKKHQLRYEINYINEAFQEALEKNHYSVIKELSDLYFDIIEKFLELLCRNNGDLGLSYMQANEVLNFSLFFDDWRDIKKIFHDIEKLFDYAIRNENTEGTNEIFYLYIKVINLAIEKRDNFVTILVFRFIKKLYSNQNVDKHSYLIRAIKHISDYLEWKLYEEKQLSKKMLQNLLDITGVIFLTLKDLLRTVYDRKDKKIFTEIIDIVDKMFKSKYPKENARILELNYNMEKRIGYQLQTRQQQLYFGLAAFLLEELRKNSNNENREIIKEFFEIVIKNKYAFKKLEYLTDIYLGIIESNFQEKVIGYWGWNSWDIYFRHKIDNLFLISAMKLIKNEKVLYSIQEPFCFLIRYKRFKYKKWLIKIQSYQHDLLLMFNVHKNNLKEWNFILTEKNYTNVLESIESMFNQLKKIDNERKNCKIRKRKISLSKIEEFKKNFKESFNSWVGIRKIFKEFQLIKKNTTDDCSEEEYFGICELDNKAAFFDKWHVDYSSVKLIYAESMAKGENSAILNKILDKCQKKKQEELDLLFESPGLDLSKVIILAINFIPELEVLKNKYISRNNIQNNDKKDTFEGWYKSENNLKIPVYNCDVPDIREKITVILNMDKLGYLIQKSPIVKDFKGVQEDDFYFSIEALSDDQKLLQKYLDNPPQWLQKIGDKTDQKLYLEKKVKIFIAERFEFEKHEKFEGYKIIIN